MKENQIIYIRGGEVFDEQEEFYEYLRNRAYDPRKVKKNWKNWIAWALSDDFEVFEPQMPNKQYADYIAWKIWFEKLFPYLGDGKIILLGQSLGGAFLMRYLSEEGFPKKIHQLHFVSPVFDDEGLVGEKIGNFKANTELLHNISNLSDKVYLYQSTDDTVVPLGHAEKYRKHINFTQYREFHNRGHFDQPAFPELLQTIYDNL